MTRGIYTAATGMLAEESAQQVIAQNLANASTTGYKQQVPSFQSFDESLVAAVGESGVDGDAVGTLGHGAALDGIRTDLSDGSLQQTGNSLDVALRGKAYLGIQTPGGTEYSRDGSLTLNAQGTLVQAGTGLPVLDDRGHTIKLSQSGAISVSPDGSISVGGSSVAKLGLYSIDQSNLPTKMGDNLISVAQPAKSITADSSPNGYVQSGFLEASNVNIVKAMVTMIACQRSYEANSKALQSQDQMQDRAISQVGVVA